VLTNEKVVVIQGDPTKWYSQVVFIMNPDPVAEKVPVDFVAEAEKIIFNYVAGKRKFSELDYQPPVILSPAVKKRRFRPSFLLYGLMIAACIGLAAVVALGWLG